MCTAKTVCQLSENRSSETELEPLDLLAHHLHRRADLQPEGAPLPQWTDYSKADVVTSRYESFNFRVKTSPGVQLRVLLDIYEIFDVLARHLHRRADLQPKGASVNS